MPTKLSRYCDGVMEAGWLAAVVVVPLFFDVYSSRVFEPDKLALLRTIALVVAAAWLIKIIEEGGPRFEHVQVAYAADVRHPTSFFRLPLIAPVSALILSLLLSTLLSVTPRVSFFGSYQRLQGTYTALAYLVLFGSILANMRRRAQLDRLLTAVILTSLPVSLYGLLQRFRLDPLPWGGDTVSRVSSTMGNPIFLGAYLIMAVPITVGRVIESLGAIVREPAGLIFNVIRATIYVFSASVQLIALWFTGSRGPWLGFLAGSFFLFILLSSYWRLRWLTIGTVGLAGALGVFLVALNIPNGPLEPLRGTPALGRLGHVFETDKETGLVRVLIWRGAAQLVGPHPPLEYPDGRKDAFNFLRPLVGYGPESMYVAFNRFYPPELGQVEKRTATPDRSHNETWDALVTTGVLGLLVYLALFASIFYCGLRWLGLMQSARQRYLFFALYAGGGLAGATGLVLWRGLPFLGVGLPFGILLGLIGYLTLLALFAPPAESVAAGFTAAPATAGPSGPTRNWRAITLISLIAGVMAHFGEVHFGIAVAVSRTLFWLFAALLVVVGVGLIDEAAPAVTPVGKEGGRRKKRATAQPDSSSILPSSPLADAGVIAAILAVIGFNFINNQSRLTSVGAILWQSFTTLPRQAGRISYAILVVIATTWLLGALLTSAEAAGSVRLRAWLAAWGITLGASLGAALLYWLWLGIDLGRLSAQPLTSQAGLFEAVGRLNGILTSLYLFVAGLVLALGALLPETQRWPAKTAHPSLGGAGLAVLLALTTIIAGYTTNLRVIHADIVYKTAEGYAGAQNWEGATSLYLLASAFAPNEDYYYLFVGKGFLEIANRLSDPAGQEGVFSRARERLVAAQRLNPLNTDHTANLGRLYRWWASTAPNEGERLSRARLADAYYARATALSPNSALLWNEWAALDLTFLEDRAAALDKINHSLALDAKFDRTYALLGDYHANLARETADPAERKADYDKAGAAYQQAVALAPDAINARLALGAVYSATGQIASAIDSYTQTLDLAPPEANLTHVYRALADLYRQNGSKREALQYAELALASAPDEMRPEIQKMIAELQGN